MNVQENARKESTVTEMSLDNTPTVFRNSTKQSEVIGLEMALIKTNKVVDWLENKYF